MKLLLSATSIMHAAHCRNVLRAAGIRAELRNTWLSGAIGEIPFREGAPQVWILDDCMEAQAWAALKTAAEPPPGPQWQCRHCHEWHEPQFGACWRCGASRE